MLVTILVLAICNITAVNRSVGQGEPYQHTPSERHRAAIGTVYNRARTLSPDFGRFLQRDHEQCHINQPQMKCGDPSKPNRLEYGDFPSESAAECPCYLREMECLYESYLNCSNATCRSWVNSRMSDASLKMRDLKCPIQPQPPEPPDD